MTFVEAFGGGNDAGTGAAAAIPALTMTGGGAESVSDCALIVTEQNSGANTVTFATGTSPVLTQQQGPDGNASNIVSYAGTRLITSGDITTGTFNITWSAGARNLSAGILLRGVTDSGIIKGTPVNANGNVTIPSLVAVPSGADVVVVIIARSGSGTPPTISTTDLATAGYTVRKNAATAYGATNNFRMVIATKIGVSSGGYGGETITISGISANGVEAYSFALPASGSALTQTNTDDAGLTDAASVSFARGQNNTDDAGLTDSFNALIAHNASQTDSAGLTDAFTALIQHNVNQNDIVGLTDAFTAQIQHNANQNDDSGLTDSLTITFIRRLTIDDPVGLTDVSNPQVFPPASASQSDVIGLTDTFSIIIVHGGIMAGTVMDQIMQDLIARGYLTGTVLDRERQRLVDATAAPNNGKGLNIDDLYALNNERNRVALESVAIIPKT